MPHKWLCGFHQALRARRLRFREGRSLEPIMDVEVMTPGEFVDSIIGDHNSLQPSSGVEASPCSGPTCLLRRCLATRAV
jgi:hypothetical protein